MTSLSPVGRTFAIVAVGASLGGFQALRVILPALPPTLALAVVVVQHQAERAGASLAAALARYAAVPVVEPNDKDPVLPGHVYVAPNGYHLLVEAPGSFALSTDEPVQYARPSIDVLFDAVARTYGPRAVGVALTSSSTDGARGLAAIKSHGGLAIVQAPDTAASRVLPDAALAATTVDHVLPLDQIGALLAQLPAANGGAAASPPLASTQVPPPRRAP